MATAMKRTKKNETAKQKLERWMNGVANVSSDQRLEILRTWEAGNEAMVAIEDVSYELHYLDSGGYVIVEWDESGSICVLDRD